ncbi:hypothetical protein BTR23_09305 [Alkalihalophilus pseudofirmus]|nr:hypothetical protein BTR23_09305 [Alkalihalophilus pseudofirmus]
MDRFIKYHNKFDDFLVMIAAGSIFLMMILIFSDVLLRNLFNSPIIGTVEITGEYLMAIIVYFSISYTLKERGHVSVDLLKDKVSLGWSKFFGIVTNLLAIIAFVALGIANFGMGMDYFSNGITSRGLLDYPLWPALMIISLGLLSFCVRLLIDSINILRNKNDQYTQE